MQRQIRRLGWLEITAGMGIFSHEAGEHDKRHLMPWLAMELILAKAV
jgi:hypothetical protein